MKADEEQEARMKKGTVEAEKAGTDSIVEFQWGEHDDSGLKGHIEYINWRIVLGSIVYIPQTGEIE